MDTHFEMALVDVETITRTVSFLVCSAVCLERLDYINAWTFHPGSGDCFCHTLVANIYVCQHKNALVTPEKEISTDLVGSVVDRAEVTRLVLLEHVATCGKLTLASLLNF